MKQSKTVPGMMIIGGLMAFLVFGTVASWAGGQLGDPADDLYYDCVGWIGTVGAFAGIVAFGWGAKLFAAK